MTTQGMKNGEGGKEERGIRRRYTVARDGLENKAISAEREKRTAQREISI